MTITSEVPQESILGRLLLLLYINDIQNCSSLISTILFADDTIICIPLNVLKHWMNYSVRIGQYF